MNFMKYKYERYIGENEKGAFADKKEFLKKLKCIFDSESKVKMSGVPLYRKEGYTYVDISEDHYAVIGSTSAKKSRNIAMPTIETTARGMESMIITDSKGELAKRHISGLKARGYNVVVMDYKGMSADTWNPMEYIYKLYTAGQKDKALEKIEDFVDVLSAPSRKCTKDVYWNLMSEMFLKGCLDMMLHCCSEDEYNIKNLISLANRKNEKVLEKLHCWIPENETAFESLFNVRSTPEKTYSCIISTVNTMLKIFMINNKLCNMLSKNSFDINKIGDEPTAVFIVVPDNKETLNGVISLFVSQISEMLIEKADKSKYGRLERRVNWILDEFGNIATINGFSSMITAARSRNMRFFIFVQSLEQIENKYEDAKTIIANCSKIFLHSNEYSTLDQISKLCGTRIIGNREYPLMSVRDLQQLSKEKGEALILKNRCKPFVTRLWDIDDYSIFNFKFQDIPVKEIKNTKALNWKHVADEMEAGWRPFYGRDISKIKEKKEEEFNTLFNDIFE